MSATVITNLAWHWDGAERAQDSVSFVRRPLNAERPLSHAYAELQGFSTLGHPPRASHEHSKNFGTAEPLRRDLETGARANALIEPNPGYCGLVILDEMSGAPSFFWTETSSAVTMRLAGVGPVDDGR